MEPPDDNLIMFGEIAVEKGKFFHAMLVQGVWSLVELEFLFLFLDPVVCVICAKLARSDVQDQTNREYYHWINFLFVRGDFQVRSLTCIKELLYC